MIDGGAYRREVAERTSPASRHTGAATSFDSVVLSITYGVLRNVGMPAVNWMYVGVSMFLLFGLGQILAWLRYR